MKNWSYPSTIGEDFEIELASFRRNKACSYGWKDRQSGVSSMHNTALCIAMLYLGTVKIVSK